MFYCLWPGLQIRIEGFSMFFSAHASLMNYLCNYKLRLDAPVSSTPLLKGYVTQKQANFFTVVGQFNAPQHCINQIQQCIRLYLQTISSLSYLTDESVTLFSSYIFHT